MKIYIVGNILVKKDNVPYALLPSLKAALPHVTFEEADPNENFVPENGSVIIDTVAGIDHVRWFEDIDAFTLTKSVSPHDYDLGFHLRFLKKLHKISDVGILGLPQNQPVEDVKREVIEALLHQREHKRQK